MIDFKQKNSLYGGFDEFSQVNAKLNELANADDFIKNDYNKNIFNIAKQQITHKLSRLICGNIDYLDSWADLVGYSYVALDSLKVFTDYEEKKDLKDFLNQERDRYSKFVDLSSTKQKAIFDILFILMNEDLEYTKKLISIYFIADSICNKIEKKSKDRSRKIFKKKIYKGIGFKSD